MVEEEEATLACKVSRGMFSTERGVTIDLPGGRRVAAFVDARNVIVSQEPEPGAEVPGRVRVSLVETKKDSAIVDLPEPGLVAGPRLTVPKGMLL